MESRKVIVMTGGTAGFGACALSEFATRADTRIILGARGQDRAVPSPVEVLPLDLASLHSVRTFADSVKKALAGECIDMLVLNAGLHGTSAKERSEDGFGLTFAVNHLAHYLLARLLLPVIADGGRLVITSSNMHNPPLKRIAPKELEVEEWAHPSKGGSGDGIRSYTASKLCNMMTALAFVRLGEVKHRDIEVIAFNPGLTGGVAGRDAPVLQKALVTTMANTVFPLLGLFRAEFVMNKPQHAGHMFAEVVLGRIRPPAGRHYVSLVKGQPTFPDPSPLACQEIEQDRLWRDSAAMVGLNASPEPAHG